MSGPKVVRIVTREEIIARCQSHLAQLDVAIARWRREAEQFGGLADDELQAVIDRRAAIAALLERDQFVELQKAAPDEIEFLKSDRLCRQDKAAEAKRRARTLERRQEDAARALLDALQRRQSQAPGDVIGALEKAIAAKGDMAAALSAGFKHLSAPSETSAAQLSELAAKLKDETAPRLLADWMATQPPSADQAQLDRLEARIGALEALGDSDSAAFEVRLDLLRNDRQGAPRGLALDSLLLDVDQALAQARYRAELLDKIDLAQAELTSLRPAEPSSDESFAQASVDDLTKTLVDLEHRAAAARNAHAAEARRSAVLDGLAALGYEVGSDMSTAWVRDGKVVLRRPAQPGYGVEVMGGSQTERLQMRVVAFDEGPPDVARDRDAEVLWCGDVDKLSKSMAKTGAALVIEKAHPVGATPVKRVGAGDAAPLREAGRTPKARNL